MKNLPKPPALPSYMGSFDSVRLRLSTLRMTVEEKSQTSQDDRVEENQGLKLAAKGYRPLFYFITPRCAIPMLSRVVFFTRYIISSAWRMTSWGVLASCG